MLHVVTVLWDPNEKSESFSRNYNEKWVDRLYRGFRRNLTRPFQFVVFTDRFRKFEERIVQESLLDKTPGYGNCIEAFRIGSPMIFVGLDTLIVGNIDALADYCTTAGIIAMPRHPRELHHACNGVVLAPAGQTGIFEDWRGENDMVWMRKHPHVFLDDLFPGQVRSYKAHIRGHEQLGDARIVYFHGRPKMQDLLHIDWVKRNWKQ